jgi:acetyltransferase
MTEDKAKRLLALYDLPVTPERLARSGSEASAAARELGFPVVAKVVSADLPHKAAAGGVRLDLRTAAEVEAAYDEILSSVAKTRSSARIDGVLIQPMIRSGLELILGVKRDPEFGPMVLFGLGGVFVEAIRQTALRRAPLSSDDAREMIAEVPAFGRLLAKLYPGRNAERLVTDLLARLSALAVEIGDRVDDIDINPVMLDPATGRATVVDALIVPRPA